MPDAGPYKLGANIRFKLDDYLAVSDLTARIGSSDIRGELRWDMHASRPAIRARLESQQLDTADMGIADPLTGDAEQGHSGYWDQPLELGILSSVDLDVEVQVQRLKGLAKPLQDIVVSANADRLISGGLRPALFAVDHADDLHKIRFKGVHESIRCLLHHPFTCAFDASRSSDPA